MNKTTNKYSPEVRERSVRMVLDNQGLHESRAVHSCLPRELTTPNNVGASAAPSVIQSQSHLPYQAPSRPAMYADD
jgi:hypothetical protein